MNKNKKIAMAVVATVMAGAMVVPLAACNKNEEKEKVDLEAWNVLKENGDLDYSVYEGNEGVTLNIAIGHDSAVTSTAFASGTTVTLADGNTYQGGKMKPAWAQMEKDLHIKWNDVYTAKKTNANLEDLIANSKYEDTDMFTTDLSKAVDKVAAGTDILNLADYLDYMPNFKNFLESNPIVYLSLLQDGMSTTDGSGKALYIAPYFDGNDDIERYCIIRQDWADIILNGDTALAPGNTLGKSVAVQPFMPGTGSLEVDITLPTPDAKGNYTQVGKVYKNYSNVLSLVKATGDNALKTAYLAASNNNAYTGNSGNIVALMNAAMTVNSGVTGDKLAALFRAYVDACYTTTASGTTSYYTAATRSNLFNGYDAAWDVDDLVAMLRCVMTNKNTLLTTDDEIADRDVRKIYGIAPRGGTNDRTPDMVRLACQLYGARGADSRYEYTYIDNDGKLQDARNDKAFYEALDKFSKLAEEGLVANYSGISSFSDDAGYIDDKGVVEKDHVKTTDNAETFMMYDYCQTQTRYGFYQQAAHGKTLPDGYNFAPILTPVSQWDVNGKDGIEANEYFRFTESWRSTKTSGLALNGGLAYDAAKLKAALQFVDYLYSEDGQIVSTFGPMATNAQGAGGFWYGEEQTSPTETTYDNNGNLLTSKNYFKYKGTKYQGYNYKGTVAPKITAKVYSTFQGATGSPTLPETVKKATLSFTNYARMLIGSTLPIGVKSQAFEDQLTSDIGKAGSAKVAAALSNKVPGTDYTVVRGMSLDIKEGAMWYTCVPSGLPVPTSYVSTLIGTDMIDLRYLSGEAKKSNDTAFLSIFNSVILGGIKSGSQHKQQDITYDFTTVDALVGYMSTEKKGQTRENVLSRGWDNAYSYWNYLKPAD